jgi:hypothetical protein
MRRPTRTFFKSGPNMNLATVNVEVVPLHDGAF